jgi:peptidoglycan-associated lipoprotein
MVKHSVETLLNDLSTSKQRREKMRKNVWLAIGLVLILSAMVFTSSCAQKMVQTDSVPATQQEVSKESDKSAKDNDQDRQSQEDRLRAEGAVREVAGTAFVNERVHFAFDSALLSEQAQQILISKADYLRTHSEVMVTVEGHCDERGTDAYNIALGERRAEAVKNFLVDLGIGSNRLNTISYGEERPIALGQNELSWAKNRRAQLVNN